MTNDFDKGCSIYQSVNAARDSGYLAEAMNTYEQALGLDGHSPHVRDLMYFKSPL